MSVHSVLASANRGQIRLAPFPHLILDGCLPAAYFDALAAAYPSNDTVFEYCKFHPRRPFAFQDDVALPNTRYDISAFQILDNPEPVAPIWREFVRYHTSPNFFAEFVSLFGAEVRHCYPSLERSLGKPLQTFSTGVRFASDCDLSLDCQIGINSPATTASSVRHVHTDATVELFAILLYFKTAGDETGGGDLELYRWKDPKKRRFIASEVDPFYAERVETISYQPNRLVMFLNTQSSLHAVSPRQPSCRTRRLVNIIGEVDRSLPRGLYQRPKTKNLDYFLGKLGLR